MSLFNNFRSSLSAKVVALAMALSPFGAGSNNAYSERVIDYSDPIELNLDLPNSTFVRADLDGDGKDDIAIYQPSSGTWRAKLTNDGQIVSGNFGGIDWTPVSGDYDGDKKSDPVIYNKLTGEWGLLLSSANYDIVSGNFGGINWTPVSADFDGDGKTDPTLYNESTGDIAALISSQNYQSVGASFGGPGYKTAIANYDTDGKSDLAVVNNGNWFVVLSESGYSDLINFQFGDSSTVSVKGDFDGDGKEDPTTYQEDTGIWDALLSGNNYTLTRVQRFGGPDYRPITGDFNGDGATDFGIINKETGKIWYNESSISTNDAPIPIPTSSITITSPTNSQTFVESSNINLETILENMTNGTSKVQFFNGSTLLGEDMEAPYSFTLPNASAGNYSFVARAYDSLSNIAAQSQAVNAQVYQLGAPTISIYSPTNNQEVIIPTNPPAPVNLSIDTAVSDNERKISKVEFYDWSAKMGEDMTAPYSFNWANVPVGNHSLTVVAYYGNNNAITSYPAIKVEAKYQGEDGPDIPDPSNPPPAVINFYMNKN